MAIIKKPVKKTASGPKTKTITADDFDDNPATIMRNGGKVKKMGNGGKIIKGFSKPVSDGADMMRNGGKVKPKMKLGGKMKK